MTRYSLILVDFDIVGLLSCAVHEEVRGEGGEGTWEMASHYILNNVKTLQS